MDNNETIKIIIDSREQHEQYEVLDELFENDIIFNETATNNGWHCGNCKVFAMRENYIAYQKGDQFLFSSN